MRQFAKEKIKRWVRLMLHTQDTPERTSVAFALGVFIAFLPPVPWFHTLFALLLAFVFRLNRLATLIGTYVNTPFTLLPLVAGELSVGILVLGGPEPPELTWRQLQTGQGWKDAFIELKPFLAPLMLGSLVLGLIGAALAYVISLRLILAYRKRVGHEGSGPLGHEPTGPAGGTQIRKAEGLSAETPAAAAASADASERRS